jgi:serine phosphatase RsbU (regulator of sigma subunit)
MILNQIDKRFVIKFIRIFIFAVICVHGSAQSEDHNRNSLVWNYYISELADFQEEGEWKKTVSPYFTFDDHKARYLWLRTQIPDHMQEGEGLYLPDAKYQVRVLIGDDIIFSSENSREKGERVVLGTGPYFVPISANKRGSWLYLRIFSNNNRIGIPSETRILSRELQNKYNYTADFWTLSESFFFLTLAIFCLLLFVLRQKKSILFWFLSTCFCFGGYSLTLLLNKELLWNNRLGWLNLGVIFFGFMPTTFSFLLRQIFINKKSKSLNYVSFVTLTASLCFVLLHLLNILEVHKSILYFQIYIVLFSLVVLTILFRWARAKDRVASSITLTIFLLILGVTHDVAVSRSYIPKSINLTGFFTILFILRLFITVAFRIYSREREIQIYLSEIETAKHLHKKFMGLKKNIDGNLEVEISNYPATKLGGDWYLFNKGYYNWNYLFLGDITGHGIQAALTTTFLQGLSDEFDASNSKKGPIQYLSDFHRNINARFYERGKGELTLSLITLAINLETWEFYYCNSGHPSLIKISNTTYPGEILNIRNSGILGINSEISELNVGDGILRESEFLILHTDGVIDILNSESKTFTARKVMKFISSANVRSPHIAHELIESKLKRLSVFERSDDVTFATVHRIPKSS